MYIISLIISVVAIAVALSTKSRTSTLDERFTNFYGTINELNEKIEELKKALTKMQFAQLKAKGEIVFSKDMKIHDAINMHPDAQSVFASFHLGCCSACAIGKDETIEEGALSHEVDLDKLLDALNKLD